MVMEKQTVSESKELVVTENSAKEVQDGALLDVTAIFDNIERLLTSTEIGATMHAKLADYLEQVKPVLNDPEVKIPEKGKEILAKANDFVQKRPLTTLGIATGTVLLALLAKKRK